MSFIKKSPSVNGWMVTTFLLLGLIVGYGLNHVLDSSNSDELEDVAEEESVEEVAEDLDEAEEVQTFIAVDVDDDAVLGAEDAPITVVEFSDFACYFCEKFYSETFGQIVENYIDTGKVRFVYRDFPGSSGSPNATEASEVAECASEQGEFWAMHDMLFEQRSGWVGLSDPTDVFIEYAETLGLDSQRFASCLQENEQLAEVRGDLQDGLSYGATATPTFFINGQKIVGAQPYSAFAAFFDSILDE